MKDDTAKCQYANYLNYTDCEDSSTDDSLVDPSRIKEIFFPFNASDVTDEDLELEKLSGKVSTLRSSKLLSLIRLSMLLIQEIIV